MITKTIEILDRMTCIPALATQLDPACERDRQLFARAGYGLAPSDQGRYVLLCRLVGGACTYDCHAWGDRTMAAAHAFIIEHWAELKSGDVVDVEYILGETSAPKPSELG